MFQTRSPPRQLHDLVRKVTSVYALNFVAIKLFNRLPKIIQSLKEDRMSFRNKLSSYLMSTSFYTVSEYLECKLNN
jgi:hypothetical protein